MANYLDDIMSTDLQLPNLHRGEARYGFALWHSGAFEFEKRFVSGFFKTDERCQRRREALSSLALRKFLFISRVNCPAFLLFRAAISSLLHDRLYFATEQTTNVSVEDSAHQNDRNMTGFLPGHDSRDTSFPATYSVWSSAGLFFFL